MAIIRSLSSSKTPEQRKAESLVRWREHVARERQEAVWEAERRARDADPNPQRIFADTETGEILMGKRRFGPLAEKVARAFDALGRKIVMMDGSKPIPRTEAAAKCTRRVEPDIKADLVMIGARELDPECEPFEDALAELGMRMMLTSLVPKAGLWVWAE